MTPYYFFFTIIGILALILTHIVTKKYAPYILNYIINEDLNWNPNSDRIKLTFVIAFFIAPFVFIKQLWDLNHKNDFFNYTCLSFIILSMIFCIWMIRKIIKTEFNLKSNSNLKIHSYFKNKDSFNKCQKLLKEHNIINENYNWVHNRSTHKKKYIPVLICKLISLKLIKFKEYKEVHNLFEESLNVNFDYNHATQIIKLYTKEELFLDDDSAIYFEKLQFLDKINSNK